MVGATADLAHSLVVMMRKNQGNWRREGVLISCQLVIIEWGFALIIVAIFT